MNIVKLGNCQNKKGEFYFVCKKCGCEWYADRGDEGLGISPPCSEFYAYMKCPTCKAEVIDKEYENDKLYFDAYDKYGNKTTNPFDMMYVHIDNLSGMENFKKLCKINNITLNIQTQTEIYGWYIFNSIYNKYIYYTDWMISLHKKFFERR